MGVVLVTRDAFQPDTLAQRQSIIFSAVDVFHVHLHKNVAINSLSGEDMPAVQLDIARPDVSLGDLVVLLEGPARVEEAMIRRHEDAVDAEVVHDDLGTTRRARRQRSRRP